MHLFRRAIAKMCKGLQAKHSHVAGCLVEERRPLTARWPFPNLAGIHSRFLGPAKKSIIKSYSIYIICTIQLILHKKCLRQKLDKGQTLKASNVQKGAITLLQSTRPGNCFKSPSASEKNSRCDQSRPLSAQIYAPTTLGCKVDTNPGDCTLVAAGTLYGTEEWWRKMRTLPSAFFL